VVKPEWGFKRTCLSCAARFYDLGKAQAACPKCGAIFDPDVAQRARRGKAAAAPPPPQPRAAEPAEELETADAEPAAEGEEEEEAVMEDTSELGDEEEDVAEVIENVEDDEERS
jgi:uncharacterized protein (TIGR02300 family)